MISNGMIIHLIIRDSLFTGNMSTIRHQIDNTNMVIRTGKRSAFAKIYVIIHNYLIMTQNIGKSSSGNISFKSSMWEIILFDLFSCSIIRYKLLIVKKENNLRLFYNFLYWSHKSL